MLLGYKQNRVLFPDSWRKYAEMACSLSFHFSLDYTWMNWSVWQQQRQKACDERQWNSARTACGRVTHRAHSTSVEFKSKKCTHHIGWGNGCIQNTHTHTRSFLCSHSHFHHVRSHSFPFFRFPFIDETPEFSIYLINFCVSRCFRYLVATANVFGRIVDE